MHILAIESSCDETAVAITKNKEIIAATVKSQANIHKEFGGVVPEVSARNHLETIIPTINHTLKKAKIEPKKLSAIAVTQGPGLLPSLLIGVDTAKALSFAWEKPLIAVNHLEGHIYSAFLKEKPQFPAITLLVSGGHTMIILMTDHGKYKILGETLDDAAGEAFDKVAKMLGLPYPGGPELAKIANFGNANSYHFAKPLLNKPNFDFSFSGLKSDVLRTLNKKKTKLTPTTKQNIAASFQKTVVDILITKLCKAVKKHQPKTVIITGGVAANTLLRSRAKRELKHCESDIKLIFPEKHVCTDNAEMIARAAYEKYKSKDFADHSITADPNLSIN